MQERLQKMGAMSPIRVFLNILHVRDRETALHSVLVTRVAVEIGKVMGINQKQLVQLYYGALLHDIGKLAVPSAILSKPAMLDKFERDIIMQHPVLGYTLIRSVNSLDMAAYVILSHHERYDGQGYPFGLRGDNIHFLARICAVADALAAMLVDRPYRKRVSTTDALAEVHSCRGTQFDPAVVDALQLIDMKQASYSALSDENYLKTMLGHEKGAFERGLPENFI